MKKIQVMMLLFVSAIFPQNLKSQPLQTGFHYRINNSRIIYYHIDKATFEQKKICGKYLKANVKQLGDTLKLDFWRIIPETDGCKTQPDKVNSSHLLGKRFFYHLIVKRDFVSDPTDFVSLQYVTWETGLTTIPFKYRFGKKGDAEIPNDASTSVNAGIYIGKKWGRTRFYEDKDRSTNSLSFTAAIFVSPTVISLSPETTQNEVATKSNEFGIGYGFAGMLSYRDINFGLLFGIDSPISGESDLWIYANRPWFGFGIGYKLGILGGK